MDKTKSNELSAVGRVRVVGYKAPRDPDLSNPEVVRQILEDARRTARRESVIRRGRLFRTA